MLSEDKRAGILVTVAVHLTVIIVLLLTSITVISRRGSTFLLAFEDEVEFVEKKEMKLEEEPMTDEEMDAIQRSIEQMIAQRQSQSDPHRNIITTRNADARGTDADKLYEDAERLAEALKNGQLSRDENSGDIASPTEDKGDAGKKDDKKIDPPVYSGASILSWKLDGRKAYNMPVPAYKCYGGGSVTVIIKVNPAGRVLSADVEEGSSSTDPCLRKWARSFAMQARFSDSSSAPNPQVGNIVYEFIAQ
jgi:hypothetical protein